MGKKLLMDGVFELGEVLTPGHTVSVAVENLEETVTSAESTPAASVVVVENTPKSSVIPGKNCAFKLEVDNKLFKVWIFGALRDVNNYKKIISILYSLPGDFTVHIYLHTPGGSISVGCNILTAMERCKATIVTHNIGMAASCGSLILAFGDKIHVDPNTITMFHHAGFGNQDSAHRLLTQTNHVINNVMNLFSRMQARGIISEDEIEGIVKSGKEYYLTSNVMEERLKSNGLWYEGTE